MKPLQLNWESGTSQWAEILLKHYRGGDTDGGKTGFFCTRLKANYSRFIFKVHTGASITECVCVCERERVTADTRTIISATAGSSVCIRLCGLTYSDTCMLNLPHFLFARARCPPHSFCNRPHNRHFGGRARLKKKVLHIITANPVQSVCSSVGFVNRITHKPPNRFPQNSDGGRVSAQDRPS